MEFPEIISFYTEDTPYKFEVKNLIDSCVRFGLSYTVEGVENLGTWELNCAFKPFFILQQLEKLKKPVLWVDADGVIENEPTWQEAFGADLAVRLDKRLPSDHPSRVITSTIFAKPNAIPLLKDWIRKCHDTLTDPHRQVEFWDQIALRDAILDKSPYLEVAPLPLSYAKIFDHPQDNLAAPKGVIVHYQASRRYKHFVK